MFLFLTLLSKVSKVCRLAELAVTVSWVNFMYSLSCVWIWWEISEPLFSNIASSCWTPFVCIVKSTWTDMLVCYIRFYTSADVKPLTGQRRRSGAECSQLLCTAFVLCADFIWNLNRVNCSFLGCLFTLLLLEVSYS